MAGVDRISWSPLTVVVATAVLLAVGLAGRARSAATSDMESAAEFAVAYLASTSQQAADGSWGSDPATRVVYTTQVVCALRSYAGWSPAYERGITWIENHADQNHDELARRILALMPHGDSVQFETAELAAANNGGWGLTRWYDREPRATALAMRAFDVLGAPAQGQLGIGYLKLSSRLADGSWPAARSGTNGDANTTAEVALALGRYRTFDASLQSTILPAAESWLVSNVTATSAALTRALTLQALLEIDPNSPAVESLFNSLMPTAGSGGQLGNGSWENSVFATAAVLEALARKLQRNSLTNLVFVPDAQLRRAINASLGRNAGDALRVVDMRRLINLQAQGFGIANLEGLGEATNLLSANLSNNSIATLSPISALHPHYLNILGNNPPFSAVTDTDGDLLADISEGGTGLYSYSKQRGTIAIDPDTDDDGWSDKVDDYPHDDHFHLAEVNNVHHSKLDLNRAVEAYPDPIGRTDYLGLDDFLIFWKSYGKQLGQVGFHPDADFDNDNDVDANDFMILGVYFPTGWSPPAN